MSAIRGAWIAGVVNVVFSTLMLGYWLMHTPADWLHVLSLIEFAIALGLCFWVHRKSRVAAVLLLLLFAAGKAQQFLGGGPIDGWPLALLFVFFFARGVVGTFMYHRLIAKGLRVQAPGASSTDGTAPAPSSTPNTASGTRWGAMLGLGLGVGGFQMAYPFMAETMPWLVANTDRTLLAALFGGLTTGLGTWIGRLFDLSSSDERSTHIYETSAPVSPSVLETAPPTAPSPGLSAPTATVMLSAADGDHVGQIDGALPSHDREANRRGVGTRSPLAAVTPISGRSGEALVLEFPGQHGTASGPGLSRPDEPTSSGRTEDVNGIRHD